MGEVCKVSPSDRVQQRFVVQISLTFPFRVVGGLHGPVATASSSHSRGAAVEVTTGIFELFSQKKKGARLGPHSGLELSVDFSSSTPLPQVASGGLLGGRRWWHVDPGCPLACGTFCAVSQKCTRTLLGGEMGFGCFFLVLRDERGAGKCSFWYALFLRGLKQPLVE